MKVLVIAAALLVTALIACFQDEAPPTFTPYPTPLPPSPAAPLPTATPYPTYTPAPTHTPYPTPAPPPTTAPLPTATPYPTYTPFPTPIPAPTAEAAQPAATYAAPTQPPLPTATPYPTYTPFPTPIPAPTAQAVQPAATYASPTPPPVPRLSFGPVYPPGRIAFTSVQDRNREIYIMQADGSEQLRLTFNNSPDNLYDYDPKSDRLLFSRNGTFRSFDTNGVNIGRWGLTESPSAGNAPHAGHSLDFHSSHRYVYVRDDIIATMTAEGHSEIARGHWPRWSPNGRRIAFASEATGDYDIYVMNIRDEELLRLTNHPSSDAVPDWSPDGRRIAFQSGRDGKAQIYTMNTDGSGVAKVTAGRPPIAQVPRWPVDTLFWQIRHRCPGSICHQARRFWAGAAYGRRIARGCSCGLGPMTFWVNEIQGRGHDFLVNEIQGRDVAIVHRQDRQWAEDRSKAKADGTAACWGLDDDDQASPPMN